MPELKASAVRIVTEALPDNPNRMSAINIVANLLGVGADQRGKCVLLLIDHTEVTVINLFTGEILAINRIEPDKTTGETPSGQRADGQQETKQ